MVRGDVDPSDPLGRYPSFSLFPRSFNHLQNPDSHSLLSHLKSMALKDHDELVNQAKTILDDSSDLLKMDRTSATGSENEKEAPFGVNNKNLQERRPALGLKRAKFSAKPLQSQPDLSLEPVLNIDELKDPEEFFAAFERNENAIKELQKQRGQPLLNLDQNRASKPLRSRRPSLLGKPATYKHRSYSATGFPGNGEALMSSQESLAHDILSPSREDVIHETKVVNRSPRARVSDSTSTMNNRKSEFDELLSYSFEGLDEDGVRNLLENKLNLKPVDFGRPSFPDLPDVRRREYKSSSGASPKMKDSIFHTNTHHQVSPTLPKSPLASFSLLNRHISKFSPAKDPFSALEIDSSHDTNSHLETLNIKHSDQVDKEKELLKPSRSPVNIEESTRLVSSPSGSAGNTVHNDIESTKQLNQSAQTDSPEFGGSPARGEGEIEPSGEDPHAFAANDEGLSAGPIEQEDEVPAAVRQEKFNEGTTVQNSSINKANKHVADEGGMDEARNADGSSVKVSNENMTGPFKTAESTVPYKENVSGEVAKTRKAKAKSDAPASEELEYKRRKVEAPPRKKIVRKSQRRNSIAAVAGTKWEAGVRRSTRMRMRPLEYWKGERFLYGRVHQSMVSVIGVKYASPTADSKQPAVKVKSFVSDQYKDLVNFAALH